MRQQVCIFQEVRPRLITAIIISSRFTSFVLKPIMKIHALATLAFITANGVKAQVVENPCVICPNGATAGDDLAPGADAGILTTCKELIETAPLHETGSLPCASYGFYEATCCPPVEPPQDPCTFCPNGVTVADDIATSYGCSDIITGLSLIESESDTCKLFGGGYEYFCCPPPPENPCNICPNGTTVGDDFVLSGIGITCVYLINQAIQRETGSAFCGYAEAYEISCCPEVTAATTVIPVEETSTSATATAIPEIDGGTATTTTAPAVATSTSTNATASPESNDAASGGVAISGFIRSSFVSVVSAWWAIGLV